MELAYVLTRPYLQSRRHMQPPSEAHLRLAEGADGRFSAESVDCPRVYHLNLVMRVRSRARTRTCATSGLHLLAPIEAWWGLVLLAMHVALVQPYGQLNINTNYLYRRTNFHIVLVAT